MLKNMKLLRWMSGKKVLVVLMTMALLLSCFGALGVAARTSPVQNGDFEQADTLANAIGWVPLASGSSDVVSREENGPTGAYMLIGPQHGVETAGDYLIAVEPDTTYRLVFDAYALGMLIPEIAQYQADGSGSSGGDLELGAAILDGAADWTEAEATFKTSSDTTMIGIRFMAVGGEAAVDNVDLWGGVYSDKTVSATVPDTLTYATAVDAVPINSALATDTVFEVGYNAGNNRTYFGIQTANTLPVANWIGYSGTAEATITVNGAAQKINVHAAGFGNANKLQIYTPDGSGDFRSATKLVIPKGASFTANGVTVTFVQDFVLTNQGNGWTKDQPATYIDIDASVATNTVSGVGYNGSNNRTYIGLSTALTLPQAAWGGYSGNAMATITVNGAEQQVQVLAAGYGSANSMQVYTAEGTGDFTAATKIVIPAGAEFSHTASNSVIRFPKDFVIVKAGGAWKKDEPPVIPTDHTTMEGGGQYLPDGATNLSQNDTFENDNRNGNTIPGYNLQAAGNVIEDGMLKLTTSYVQSANVSVTAGKKYTLSAYVWISSAAANLSANAFMTGGGTETGGWKEPIWQVKGATGEWIHYTYTWTAKNTDIVSFGFKAHAGSVIYMDDISLFEVVSSGPEDHTAMEGGGQYLPEEAVDLSVNGTFADANRNGNLITGYNLQAAGNVIEDGMLKLTTSYVQSANVNVTAGKKYTLSAYVWVDTAASGMSANAFMTGGGTATGGWKEPIWSLTTTTTGWEHFTYTWVAKETGSVSFGFKAHAGSVIYMDDISLYEVVWKGPVDHTTMEGGGVYLPSGQTNLQLNGDLSNAVLSGTTIPGFNLQTGSNIAENGVMSVVASYVQSASINVTGGKTYELSFFANVTNAAAGFSGVAYMAGSGTATGGWVEPIARVTAASGWVQYTYRWTAAADGAISFGFKAHAGSTYWLDDISVYEIVPTGNLLIDQGHEANFDRNVNGWNVIGVNVTWDGTVGLTEPGSIKLDHSQPVEGTTNYYAYTNVNPLLKIEAGKNYKFNYSYKTTGTPVVEYVLTVLDASGNTLSKKTIGLTASTDWKSDDYIIAAGEGAEQLRIDLVTQGGADPHNFGVVWFDDLAVTETAEAAYEGLLNGDFEQDLRFWAKQGNGELKISTDPVHGGNKALLLDRRDTNIVQCASQTVSVEPGQEYLLTYYHKIVGGGQVYVAVYQFNENGSVIASKQYNITYVTGDQDWKRMVARFTAAEGAASVRFDFYNNELNGCGYIDDVTLEEVAPIVDDALLKNGDFSYRDFATWKTVNYKSAGDFDYHEDELGFNGTQGFGRVIANDTVIDAGGYFGISSASCILPQPNASYHLAFYVKANEVARNRNLRVMITRQEKDANGNYLAIPSGAYSSTDVKLANTDGWQKIELWFDANGVEAASVAIFLYDGEGEAVIDIDCATMELFKTTGIGGNFDFQAGVVGTAPANWSRGGHPGGTFTTVASPSGIAGDLAGMLTFPENNYEELPQSQRYIEAVSQFVEIEPGKTYEISYWGKVNGSAQGNGWLEVIQWSDKQYSKSQYSSPNGVYQQFGLLDDTSAWQQVRFTFRATTKFGLEKHYVDLRFAARGECEFIFDNLQIRELPEEELATNMDFENDHNSDGIPDGWYLSVARDMEAALSIDTSVFHDGKQSMKVHSDSEMQLSHLDSAALFAVTEGQVYEFSFWMMSANAPSTSNVKMRMYFYDANGEKLARVGQAHAYNDGRQVTLNSSATRDEWSQVYTRTVIPAGAKYASLQFYFGPGGGDLWIDDIFVGMVMDTERVADAAVNIVAHSEFHAVDHTGKIAGWELESLSGSADFTVENKPEDADYDKDDNAYSYFDGNGELQNEYYADYGRLTATGGENYLKFTTTAVSTNYQYQVIGRYRASEVAKLKLTFYNFNGVEVAGRTREIDLSPTDGDWGEFVLDFIAPSVTYTSVSIGLEGAGTVDVDNVMFLQAGLPITQGAWSGQWIWYNEDYKESQQEYRYFRYEFDLADEAAYAPVQVTADDKFAFYVNGVEVYNNLDTTADSWSEVQIIYLAGGGDLAEGESLLKKGKNVFAFKVFNNVSECGLLYDGKWTLKNGNELQVVSDRALTKSFKTDDPKNRKSEPANDANGNDWKSVDYQMVTVSGSPVTGKWSTCKSFGVPPCSPWGNIFYTASIYSRNFITITDMVGADATVNDGVFVFELSMILDEALTTNVPLKAAIWVKNSVNEVSSGSLTPITNTDMTMWPVGKEFTVKFQMRVPGYLESGKYTLQWDDTFISIKNEDITDNKFISFELENEVVAEDTQVEMITENGAPTIKVNGEIVSYYAYSRPDHNSFTWDYEPAMINSGIDVYTVRQGGLGKNSMDMCWPADGVIDYEAWDDPIYETLANNPDAYLCVQVAVFAPMWWFDKHPEDRVLVSNENGTFSKYAESQSFASETFMKEAGEVIRLLMEHMKGEAYYNRVIDIQVTCGTSFEGMYWGNSALTYFPDFSEPFIKGFQSWLEEKYGTVEALQEAWGDDSITTFHDYVDYDWDAYAGMGENAVYDRVLPQWYNHISQSKVRPLTFTEQVEYRKTTGNDATFLNLNRGKEQQIRDQNQYLMDAITDNYLYWGHIIDETLGGTRLLSCYNGYLFAGAGAQDISAQHTSFTRILRDDTYDFFVSPASYSERDFGVSDTFMGAQDTIQSYGKMAVIEEDHRSSLIRTFASSWDASDDHGVGATRTMEEFLDQLKKNTANAMVSGNGLWMFDMQGGWFDDDQFYQLSQEIREEWDISQYLSKDLTGEVAYYIDEEFTPYFTRNFDSKSAQILAYNGFRMQRKELHRIGDIFDVYLISSLVDDKVEDHKINIIFSAYELTAEEKAAIDRNLKKDGKIVVWVYANGVTDGDVNDIDMMSALTGIPMVLEERYGTQKVIVTDESDKTDELGYLTNGLTGEVYGVETSLTAYNQSPIIYGDAAKLDSSYEILGVLQDNGEPALIAKDMGEWTSIYSAGVALPATMIRNLMAMEGVHTYTDDLSMNIIQNGAYLKAHTTAEGEHTLKLPENRAVYDVYEHKFVSMDTDTITFTNKENGTKLFRLTTPNTYLVVSRVTGGHGTISTIGATEVPVGEGYKLTITPDKGYEVASITINGEEVKNVTELSWAELTDNKSIDVRFKKIGTTDQPVEDEPTDDKPTDTPPSGNQPTDEPDEPTDDEPPADTPDQPTDVEPIIEEIITKVRRLNWTAILGIVNTTVTSLAAIAILIWFLVKRKKQKDDEQKGA